MRLIQYFLALFASVLTIAITGKASVAFTIIPNQPGATENWTPTRNYPTGVGTFGITEVDTRLWTDPPRLGGSLAFYFTLNLWALQSERGIFGWYFESAQRQLNGSFKVRNYIACGIGDLCGIEYPIDPGDELRDNGSGASFLLEYLPASGDPQLGQNKVHWIQIARASFASKVPGYISNVWFLDNFLDTSTPYADEVSAVITENLFRDVPYNPINNPQRRDYFEAQLYLVEETTPLVSIQRRVKIYNGIRWGWKYYPDEYEIQDPCNGNSGGGGCPTTTANRTANPELSSLNTNNTSGSSTSIPESTSTFGLLVLAAWSVIGSIKIKKGKQQ